MDASPRSSTHGPAAFAPPPSGRLSLEQGEVHVWRAELGASEAVLAGMRALLSDDERERAGRFHFQRDRSAFAVSRGVLRTLAGLYLDAPPEQLRFDYTPYGKPYLAGQFAGSTLRFNLSHSHEVVLYAFTSGVEVGVDVEYIRPELAGAEIAERFFSPREAGALFALPAAEFTEAFFKCWTRKEAFIKAVGQGLSFPLDQFVVSLAPRDQAALLSVRGDAREAARWSIRDVSPGQGYAAALAYEGEVGQVRCWRWQFDV